MQLRNGAGIDIPASVLSAWEVALQERLSNVQLSVDPVACDNLTAAAFTVGQRVFLRNRPDWNSRIDRLLLAHEMVHVVQNRRGTATPLLSHPSDQAEREACSLAPILESGRTVMVQAAPAGYVQRAATTVPWPAAFKTMGEAKIWIGNHDLYNRAKPALKQTLR